MSDSKAFAVYDGFEDHCFIFILAESKDEAIQAATVTYSDNYGDWCFEPKGAIELDRDLASSLLHDLEGKGLSIRLEPLEV